jgi:predicted nucleotidyltransferase
MADSGVPAIEIDPAHWLIVGAILRSYVPDLEVWAFGSRARRAAKPYSDLDLAIISETPLPAALAAAMAEAFSQADLPWKVDLLDWNSVSPEFKALIERDSVCVQPAAPPPACQAP